MHEMCDGRLKYLLNTMAFWKQKPCHRWWGWVHLKTETPAQSHAQALEKINGLDQGGR